MCSYVSIVPYVVNAPLPPKTEHLFER